MDGALPELLRDGVPTGIDEPIAPSGVWCEVDVPEEVNGELHVFDSPWKSDLKDPELLMRMVQADVDMGFAEWLPGGLPQARERYGDRCTAGRLGLVCKDGADPRLIGDSAVSGANGRCRISEKIELPSLADVVDFVSRHDDEVWVGFILDVTKAHKRVLVAHGERGYRLYVDDLLCLLRRQFALPGACLLVMLAGDVGMRLGHTTVVAQTSDRHFLSLDRMGISLGYTALSCQSARGQAECAASGFEFDRAPNSVGQPEECAILGWQASLVHVWSSLASAVASGLFHLIHKPALRFASLSSCQLQSLVHSVDDPMRVRKEVRRAAVRVGWVVLEAQGSMLRDPEELLHCRLKNGRAWIKLADYDSSMVMVNEEEAGVARFLRGLLETSVCVPLVRRELKGLLCAADAYAEGDFAGLGGWWLLPGSKLELGTPAHTIAWHSHTHPACRVRSGIFLV